MGMVGKVNKETFVCKTAAFSLCLVIAKMFIMGLMAQFLVFLVRSSYQENLENATKKAGLNHISLSFFYGLLPPAVINTCSIDAIIEFNCRYIYCYKCNINNWCTIYIYKCNIIK